MTARHLSPTCTRRRHRTLATGVIVFTLALAACGGKDGDTMKRTRTVESTSHTAPTQASVPATPPTRLVADSQKTSAMWGDERASAPEHPVTYEEAGDVFRQGHYEQAAHLFERYVVRKPDNEWGHYMLGIASWKAGDRAAAERALRGALEIDPDNAKALTNLGRVLLEEGRPEDAKAHLEHASELSPESDAVWRVLGNIQAELGEADMATESYKRALVLNDKDVWSMNNLGLLMIQRGAWEDAAKPLARAVELNPESPVFQNNLGIALERQGYTAAAAMAYRTAVGADSTYEKASVSLGRVEPLIGDARPDDVDLVALARTFEQDVGTWKGAETTVAANEANQPER